jgi:DNA-binding NarL/FixJ family response regulator
VSSLIGFGSAIEAIMTTSAIAIVEDEVLLALELKDLCQDLGYDVVGIARSADEACAIFEVHRPDLLPSDMELGRGPDGSDIVDHLREKQPSLEVVFVTGPQDPRKVRRMEAVLPRRILRKPIQEDELREALADALP